jgi:hypothetical protein
LLVGWFVGGHWASNAGYLVAIASRCCWTKRRSRLGIGASRTWRKSASAAFASL